MKKLIIAVLLAVSLPSFAQDAKPASPEQKIVALQQENAELKLELATARILLFRSQIKDENTQLANARANAIKELEAVNPGKQWDEQQGKLVDKK